VDEVDLLGMRVEVDFVHDPDEYAKVVRYAEPDARAAILKCDDGTEIELLEFRSPRGEQTCVKAFEDAGITFVTIIVDDVRVVVERIRTAGYEIHGPIVEYSNQDGNVLVVYCFGPDRTGLTLAQFV